MTVAELKKLLNEFDDKLEVMLSDYSDDSNEFVIFNPVEGAEILKIKNLEVVSIFFNAE